MKVLIAPDKFKDALTAQAAANAIAAGVRDARPNSEIDLCAMADGGDGTGAILAAAIGAKPREATVLDPLGRPIRATWWLSADGGSAVVEMASASGLALLDPAERDPLRTTSFGTGQLLRAAVEAGAEHVLLCVGGSATVDGGAGSLQALGWRFFDDDDGHLVVPLTGGTLDLVRRMQPPAWSPRVELTILADVDNPLLGRDGAAIAFGPQKGADANAVEHLEQNLKHWAHLLASSRNVLVHAMRGGGAAGGAAGGADGLSGRRMQAGIR